MGEEVQHKMTGFQRGRFFAISTVPHVKKECGEMAFWVGELAFRRGEEEIMQPPDPMGHWNADFDVNEGRRGHDNHTVDWFRGKRMGMICGS
jgi:hypothetical protein